MSRAKERARRCLEELRSLGRQSGNMARAEAFAGVAEGYLRKAMHRGHGHGISLERFFSLLEGLEASPREFFAGVLADDPSRDPVAYVDPPKGPRPRILARVDRRLRSGVRGSIGESFLVDLEGMRLDQPEKATRLAEGAAEFIEEDLLPRLLGIFASASRSLLRLDDARHALREGIGFAVRQERPDAVADLIRRNAFVLMAEGRYERALLMSETAGILFSRGGNLERFGRTLVDQGIALFYLERSEESARALTTGLELLSSESRRGRCSALQILGLIRMQERRPEEAFDLFDQCGSFAGEGFEHGKLHWVRGCALAELQRWEEMQAEFELAVDGLLEVSPIDAALCVCHQVRYLLDAGRTREAVARAQTMRRIVVPLEDTNVVASAAARDVLSCQERGRRRLTTAVLREAERLLSESRNGSLGPEAEAH